MDESDGLVVKVNPTSMIGVGIDGGCVVVVVGPPVGSLLSVVVFQAPSSPVSASTKRLLGRRLSII